jgi:hypothetical protein
MMPPSGGALLPVCAGTVVVPVGRTGVPRHTGGWCPVGAIGQGGGAHREPSAERRRGLRGAVRPCAAGCHDRVVTGVERTRPGCDRSVFLPRCGQLSGPASASAGGAAAASRAGGVAAGHQERGPAQPDQKISDEGARHPRRLRLTLLVLRSEVGKNTLTMRPISGRERPRARAVRRARCVRQDPGITSARGGGSGFVGAYTGPTTFDGALAVGGQRHRDTAQGKWNRGKGGPYTV